MTQAEAHNFIARWRRILICWRAHSETEALRDLTISSGAMAVGGFLVFFLAAAALVSSRGWLVWLALALISVLQFCFGLWMVLRLRQVRRVLGPSPIANHQS